MTLGALVLLLLTMGSFSVSTATVLLVFVLDGLTAVGAFLSFRLHSFYSKEERREELGMFWPCLLSATVNSGQRWWCAFACMHDGFCVAWWFFFLFCFEGRVGTWGGGG